jgi:hypothetical protein
MTPKRTVDDITHESTPKTTALKKLPFQSDEAFQDFKHSKSVSEMKLAVQSSQNKPIAAKLLPF